MSRFTNWLLGVKYRLETQIGSVTNDFTGEDSAGNRKQCPVSETKIDKDKNIILKPGKGTVLKEFDELVGQHGEVEISCHRGVLKKKSNGKGIIILLCVAAGIAGMVLLWKGFADRDDKIAELQKELDESKTAENNAKSAIDSLQKVADTAKKSASDCNNENKNLSDTIKYLNNKIDSLQKGWYKCRGLDENGNRIVRHNKPNNKPKEDEKSPVKMEIIYGKYDCFKYMTSGDYRGASKK